MLLTENDLWDLMKSFFKEEGLVKQHLDLSLIHISEPTRPY